MPARIERILTRHADLFLRGRLEEMAQHYAHPVALFVDGEIRARHAETETISDLFAQRAELVRRGTTRITWEIVEQGRVEELPSPVTVEWRARDGSDRQVARLRVRYFFEETEDGQLLICMIEHLDGDVSILNRKSQALQTRH